MSTKKQLAEFIRAHRLVDDTGTLYELSREQLFGIITDSIDADVAGPIRRAA